MAKLWRGVVIFFSVIGFLVFGLVIIGLFAESPEDHAREPAAEVSSTPNAVTTPLASSVPTPPPVAPAPAQAPAATPPPAPVEDRMPAIPGITFVDVTLNLEQFDWGRWTGGTHTRQMCGRNETSPLGGWAEVCIHRHPVGDDIGRVVAFVGASELHASQLLPYLATLPYEGNQPNAARAWVSENLSQAREGQILEEQFGPATFEIYGVLERGIFMEIKANEFSAWSNRQL